VGHLERDWLSGQKQQSSLGANLDSKKTRGHGDTFFYPQQSCLSTSWRDATMAFGENALDVSVCDKDQVRALESHDANTN
jgi:hypothetical protein